jgi:CRP/FNR family transcriptional regulator, dissimilatory nitrate respiration regulator
MSGADWSSDGGIPQDMPKHAIPIDRFLAAQPLFRSLEAAALERLASGATVLEIGRGGIVFRRGERCTGVHVIVFGQVKLALQTSNGVEKVVELLGDRQSFGEAELFLESPYLLTAEALDDSKLLHIAREALFAEIECDVRFAQRIIVTLSRRLNQLISDVEAYTLQTGTQRVSSYLLNGLSQGASSDTGAILFPAKKSIIASQLNLTQEHFSRILHDLVIAGMIEVRGREVHILDADRLRTSAGQTGAGAVFFNLHHGVCTNGGA